MTSVEGDVIPVLHNVSSVQRVVDLARLAFNLGYSNLVVTKAYGGAAQSGVPEAMRIALKMGRSLIVLPDLPDAARLLSPDKIIAVTPSRPEKLVSPSTPPQVEGKTLVVFSGGEPDFTPEEIAGAERIYISGVEGKLGPVAEAALILYLMRRGGQGFGSRG